MQVGRQWHRPPVKPGLNHDDVHVWRVPLDVSMDIVADLEPILSEGEHARARQMLHEGARRRFVASHGALKKILGRYLNKRPEHVRLVAEARGKPHLASPAGAPVICFSLSHSGQFALCAVTKGRAVGVDIERLRPLSTWREIAARYFSRHERETLRAVSPARTLEAFFQGWTHKEAYSKALGQGVSRCWAQFSVPLTPSAVVVLPSVGDDGQFTLCPLDPGAGYAAAVAVRGVGWHLHCWLWPWAEKDV